MPESHQVGSSNGAQFRAVHSTEFTWEDIHLRFRSWHFSAAPKGGPRAETSPMPAQYGCLSITSSCQSHTRSVVATVPSSENHHFTTRENTRNCSSQGGLFSAAPKGGPRAETSPMPAQYGCLSITSSCQSHTRSVVATVPSSENHHFTSTVEASPSPSSTNLQLHRGRLL